MIVEFLAQDNYFGDTRTGSLAGPTGLIFILLLAVGTFLLIRNMNSRLRRLPERFPDQDEQTPEEEPKPEDEQK